MRPHARRIAGHRGTIPFHAHDHAPHAHRVSEGRVTVHADRRRENENAAGRHGLAPQAGIRSARFGSVTSCSHSPVARPRKTAHRGMATPRNLCCHVERSETSLTLAFSLLKK